MPWSIDETSTDGYRYLACPQSTRITVQISNAAISIGYGQAERQQYLRPGTATYPPNDEVLIPTVGGLWRECDEIRFKSYVPGVPANVKLTAQ